MCRYCREGAWSRDNMMERNVDSPWGPTYSQLAWADTLSLTGVEATFQVRKRRRDYM